MHWTRTATGSAATAVTAVVASLLVMLGASAQAAPTADDFDARQTIHTYPGLGSATHQVKVATGADGTSAVAFLIGREGYVSVRDAGTTVWSPATKVTTTLANDPELAVGDDGTIVASWAHIGLGAQVTVRPAGSTTWQKPVEMPGTEHQVVVGPDGAATYLATQFVSASGGGLFRLQAWRRPFGPDAKFAGPVTVSPAVGNARSSDLSIDRSGRPVVTWSSQVNGQHREVRLAVGSATNNTWSSQQVVAQVDDSWTDVRSPVVAPAPDGSLAVAYVRVQADGQHRVDARLRSAAGVLGANASLSSLTTASRLRAAATGDDTTVVAWWDGSAMIARHKVPGASSWEPEVTVGGTGESPEEMADSVIDIDLAGGPGATAVATWVDFRNEVNGEIWVRHLENGTWSPAYPLSDTADDLYWHSWGAVITVDPAGRQTVVWARHDLRDGEAGAPTLAVRSTPVPPVSLRSLAKITGTPRVAGTLTCSAGFVSASSIDYTWKRGAVTLTRVRTYRPVVADLGKRLTCTATGSNTVSPPVTTSAATQPIASGVAPKATTKPKIRGAKKVGKKLRVTPVRWNANPDRVTYQWYRGTKKIKGKKARKAVYKVQRADRGKKLRVEVIAVRVGHLDAVVRSKKVKIRRK